MIFIKYQLKYAFNMRTIMIMAVNNAKLSKKEYLALEDNHGCRNYAPLPVVLTRGEGVYVWDTDGLKYFDFLSGYCALNQGHRHPRLVAALKKQLDNITLSSRAFYTDQLGSYEKLMTEVFDYDRLLPMNTGAEGGESAVKIARKWGYDVKKVPDGKARVIFAKGNFWGRTLAACSSSSSPSTYKGFGPYMPGFTLINYNDVPALENVLQDPHVVAYMVEPIQGEAGAVVPDDGYLRQVRKLCREHRVLWIADEVQTGLGRTGKLLAVDHEDVRPDILILGKSLAGGMLPVSCVLANDEVMNVITPGIHGSTYGGNPLACAVASEAIRVLIEEKMIENSAKQGALLKQELLKLPKDIVVAVRGRGLLCAIDLHQSIDAHSVCISLFKAGLLAKETHGKTIRLMPPLIITKPQLMECVHILNTVLRNFKKMKSK